MTRRQLAVSGMVMSLSSLVSSREITGGFVPMNHRPVPTLMTQPSPWAHGCRLGGLHLSRGEEDNGTARMPAALESPIEDERRALRRPQHHHSHDDTTTSHVNDWTVERYTDPEPVFPDTVDAVTDASFEAIAGTIYHKQRLDPNVASNAMTHSIFGHRPVRSERDAGRIGIEIDGAQFLFDDRSHSNTAAVRRIALSLASKLSQGHWQGFEDERDVEEQTTCRPVAVYFNTIKQALIASKELLLMKYNAKLKSDSHQSLDNIYIFSLGQDHDIPKQMCRSERTRSGLGKGEVDAKRGLILIVQPTDYNSEFRPPGPAVGAVDHLQQLAARASVEALPAVVISPRFLAHSNHVNGGWDQSGYQQAATYGGDEPPKGPTPWIMRDFTPPVFAWVGCAFVPGTNVSRIARKERGLGHHRSVQTSRMALCQSVMQEGHAWNMFAAEVSSTGPTCLYRYLASTKTSSGRPPRDIVSHIFNEWS